jgi:hypothetical protein
MFVTASLLLLWLKCFVIFTVGTCISYYILGFYLCHIQRALPDFFCYSRVQLPSNLVDFHALSSTQLIVDFVQILMKVFSRLLHSRFKMSCEILSNSCTLSFRLASSWVNLTACLANRLAVSIVAVIIDTLD